MLDAAIANRSGPRRGGSTGATSVPSASIVAVRNATSDKIDRYRAVWLEEPVTIPDEAKTQTVQEFCKRVVFSAKKPTADSVGRWAVLTKAANPNQIVPAVAVGVVQCRINLD